MLGVALIGSGYCTYFRLFKSNLFYTFSGHHAPNFVRTAMMMEMSQLQNAVIPFEVQDTHVLEKVICGSSKLTQHKETGTREGRQPSDRCLALTDAK